MFKRIVVGLLLALIVAGVASASGGRSPVTGAAQAQEGEVPSLIDALGLVAAGVTGGIVSFLLERTTWFDKMSPNGKWWLTFGLMVGLPVVAQLLLMFVPPEIWAQLEPIWQALALGFVGWLGSQVTHKLDLLVTGAVKVLRARE